MEKERTFLISADSHVSEPPDLWTTHLGKKYGSRVPHVAHHGGSTGLQGDWIVAEGMAPGSLAMGNIGAWPREERMRRAFDFGVKDTPPAASDPAARLKVMDTDGVHAEVIHPTYGARHWTMRDAELQRACFEVTNTWIAEFCGAAPDRLLGLGQLSLHDIPSAIEEMHRCIRIGMSGVMIHPVPPPEQPFSSVHYERFWAAAAEAGVPVSLHGLPPFDNAFLSQRRKAIIAESSTMTLIEDFYLTLVLFDHTIQLSLSHILLSGLLERHPKLKLVLSEWGIAWLPQLLANVDGAYKERPDGLPLKKLPSESFREQVWITFDRDPGLPAESIASFGDRLMWASDYPHVETSWPESQDAFQSYCRGLDASVKAKIAWQNCAKLRGMKPPADTVARP